MDKTMHNIASKLVPSYDFIYSLYDLSLILASKKSRDFLGKEICKEKVIALYDVFDTSPEKVYAFAYRVSGKGEREFTVRIKNKGTYTFKTRFADFEYKNEMFRAVKVLEFRKVSAKNTLEIAETDASQKQK